jgi:hypothetical protein
VIEFWRHREHRLHDREIYTIGAVADGDAICSSPNSVATIEQTSPEPRQTDRILITTESSLCSRRYLDGQAIAPAVFAMGDGLDLVP